MRYRLFFSSILFASFLLSNTTYGQEGFCAQKPFEDACLQKKCFNEEGSLTQECVDEVLKVEDVLNPEDCRNDIPNIEGREWLLLFVRTMKNQSQTQFRLPIRCAQNPWFPEATPECSFNPKKGEEAPNNDLQNLNLCSKMILKRIQ